MDVLARRKILLGLLYTLFVIILIVLTFFSVMWFLNRPKPGPSTGEFPNSPIHEFPPGPEM